MPRRSYYEKHKTELLEKQRSAREKEREKRELEDPKPMREKFMSWEEFHERFPEADFRTYIGFKTDFERIPPMPPRIDKHIRSRGYDFWKPTEEDKESRDERIAGRLLSNVLSDDRPQPSQPQESSQDDLNNILAEHDAKKKQREQAETQNNKNEDPD